MLREKSSQSIKVQTSFMRSTSKTQIVTKCAQKPEFSKFTLKKSFDMKISNTNWIFVPKTNCSISDSQKWSLAFVFNRIIVHKQVRDWYDASEWDEVARVGPSAWIADLLREKYRAVWIDTPRARKILDVQWRNRYLANSRLLCSDEIDEAVSDFRDAALLTVLETAKRNVTSLEYNKHFVVR